MQRCVAAAALLLFSCGACGKGKPGTGSQSHAKHVSCGSDGCKTLETTQRGKRASGALAATIRANGAGLPATIPAASYETYRW